MGFLDDNSIKAVAFDIDGTFYPLWKTQLRVALASLSSLPFAVNYNKARQRMRTEDSFLSLPPLSEKEREILASTIRDQVKKKLRSRR